MVFYQSEAYRMEGAKVHLVQIELDVQFGEPI